MIMGVDLKHLQPIDYLRKFLENDIRPDGRRFTKHRPLGISIGSISTADGSCLIKLGNSTVLCGIKTEILTERPKDDRLNLITTNVELSPMCSPQFRPGTTNEKAQIVNQFLIDVLKNSKCFSLSDLVVADTKYCIRLRCDIHCLNYDGNILDASTVAFIAALKTVRLPTIKQNLEETEEPIKQKKFLDILNHPISTTFVIIDDDTILLDPTSDEEAVASSTLTITVIEGNKISNVFVPGGVRISDENIAKCITLAEKRANAIRKLILSKSEEILNS